jgi:NAD(P)H-nitrite reductase large subunit
MHHVVIGAGPAGVTACETLRDLDAAARITLISGEAEPPYSRMAIPYLLVNDIKESGTYLRKSEHYFPDHKIDIQHASVSAVKPEVKSIGFENGSSLDYDRLLIATGAAPIQPPIEGIDLPGVHQCWTLDDARAIAARAKPGTSVVLVGAGFIGCIILEALVKRGCQLTVVEREDRMVPRMLDKIAGGLLKRWCENKDITVLTNTAVDKIAEKKKKLSVSLDNGKAISAGLVITAAGVRSNIDFLTGSNIDTEQGILVNQYLQSNQDGVYAAGDVAQGRDFTTGGFAVQAVQPTAVEHGRIAATNMVKPDSLSYPGSLNMNVLDTLGLISISFGQWMGNADGDTAVLLDDAQYRYLNLQFDGEYLTGASSLGHTQHMGVLRGLIRSRVPLGIWKKRLMDDPTRLMEAYLGTVQSMV